MAHRNFPSGRNRRCSRVGGLVIGKQRDTGLTENRGFWCLYRFGKTGGRVWAQFATLPWALGWGICKSLPISGILGEPGPREENGMMQARSAGRGDGIGEWCLIFHP